MVNPIMGKNSLSKLGPSQQKMLTGWFQSQLGRWLTQQEQCCLDKKVVRLFGYHLVQIGAPDPSLRLLDHSPAKNKVVVDSTVDEMSRGVSLQADPQQLPLASDSVDGVIMHHALDFAADPHQALREVERILIPEGQLIVVGFNPWSLWGVWRLFHLRHRRPPWSGHFFTARRLSDWLSLLGFEQERVEYLVYRPPMHSPAIMQKLAFLDHVGARAWQGGGGVYVIRAVKRTITMTPIRPKWQIRKKVIPAAVEPTTRSSV